MDDNLHTFADRLVHAMENSGEKPAQLAQKVGVTTSSVSQWRTGTIKNLRPDNLFAVADALRVNARWLATGKGPVWQEKDYNLVLARMREEDRRHAEAVLSAMEEKGRYSTD